MLNNVNEYKELPKLIVTSKETWMYGYNIETKYQSPQWNQIFMNQDRKKHGRFDRM